MLTQQLARFIIETDTQSLPAAVVQAACDAVIDTVGVALAGVTEPVSRISQQAIEEAGARRQATVWGTPLATTPAEAAYANAIAAHALDFDDSHPHVRGHASAPVTATVLALGEATGASGAAVLAAYAIGLEVAGKMGRAMGTGHYMRGFHATSTVGTFGACAAAGRLWGLDVSRMQTALGVAASQLSGLVRNFGTMTKPFHAGRAARAGMQSAWLAKQGHTADTAILDGRNSVTDVYAGADGKPLAELFECFGAPWEIVDPGNWVKQWPCCYAGHRAIGGTFRLVREHGIRADEIESIAVGFLPGSDAALICTDPRTGLEGKFSVEYMLAAAVLDGGLVLETFTDEMVRREPARALMAKVRRYQIPDSRTWGLDASTDVEIVTARGRFPIHVEHTPGSPRWPLSDDERRTKFLDCAARALGASGAATLYAELRRCAARSDVRETVRATVPAA